MAASPTSEIPGRYCPSTSPFFDLSSGKTLSAMSANAMRAPGAIPPLAAITAAACDEPLPATPALHVPSWQYPVMEPTTCEPWPLRSSP